MSRGDGKIGAGLTAGEGLLPGGVVAAAGSGRGSCAGFVSVSSHAPPNTTAAAAKEK